MQVSPKDYGINHDAFRPYQLDSIKWMWDVITAYKIAIGEMPTGSGKSVVAKAQAYVNKLPVTVLTKTKVLQSQYEEDYDADVLMGKANYYCPHMANPTKTADDCLFPRFRMSKFCYVSSECEYLYKVEQAEVSWFLTLNYSLWYSNKNMRDVRSTGIVVADEAHVISESIVDYVSMTLTPWHVRTFDLPHLPGISGIKNVIKKTDPVQQAIRYLSIVLDTITPEHERLKQLHTSTDNYDIKRWRALNKFFNKVIYMLSALSSAPDDWYIRSTPAKFFCKPLTAKHVFNGFFNTRLALMSATIGNVENFTNELGISNYAFRQVPHQYDKKYRPIHVLKQCPRMGSKSTPQDYEQQAKIITQYIMSYPESWSGIILVSRKSEAELLAARLNRLGLDGRAWPMPTKFEGENTATDRQVKLWHDRLKRKSNSILITWSFWEGYNGLDERILIVAKVPFPYLGDEYERARMKYNNAWFRQRTANQVDQGLGRTRRGRLTDYDSDTQINGAVAIADMNINMVRNCLTLNTQEAMIDIEDVMHIKP